MDAIHANRYESINIQFDWTDESGPLDLGGREFLVLDASPRHLREAIHQGLDPENGSSELYISTALADKMNLGKANWFRLGVRNPGGELMTLPPVWIHIE